MIEFVLLNTIAKASLVKRIERLHLRDNIVLRSGPANLNSTISGNSGHDAGLKAWRKGVFDGQEESIGAAYSPHPQFDV